MPSPNLSEKALSREEAVNLLLTSLAMQEISLSNILNAEAEKMKMLGSVPMSIQDTILITESIDTTLRTILQKEMVLLLKLESIMRIPAIEIPNE